MAMKIRKLPDSLGSFKVISDLGMRDVGKNGRGRFAIVECPHCNRQYEADANKYKHKQPYSCGCKASELKSKNSGKKTHGGVGTRLYTIWEGMRRRCLRPSKKEFMTYNNISIIQDWNDFAVFRTWAEANGYSDNLSIDRIDGTGDYEPDNCRWVTKSVQASNKAKKKSKVLPKGVHRNGNNFSAIITVDKKKISLGTFKTIDGARNRYNDFIKENKLSGRYSFSE